MGEITLKIVSYLKSMDWVHSTLFIPLQRGETFLKVVFLLQVVYIHWNDQKIVFKRKKLNPCCFLTY